MTFQSIADEFPFVQLDNIDNLQRKIPAEISWEAYFFLQQIADMPGCPGKQAWTYPGSRGDSDSFRLHARSCAVVPYWALTCEWILPAASPTYSCDIWLYYSGWVVQLPGLRILPPWWEARDPILYRNLQFADTFTCPSKMHIDGWRTVMEEGVHLMASLSRKFSTLTLRPLREQATGRMFNGYVPPNISHKQLQARLAPAGWTAIPPIYTYSHA